MHDEISFEAFLEAIAEPAHKPKPGARLSIPDRPDPFVAPTLTLPQGDAAALQAEVVFVRASAAVGKSTMAAFVSASRGLPLLDLASVPVSTGSLRALISGLSGSGDPVAAFHGGQIPIVVDALDEGRLLSGETGFESFLETMGELLLEDRSVTTRPKLIVFGRFESAEIASIGIEVYGNGVTTSSIDVGFFGEEQARRLIDAYADAAAEPDASYSRHPGPVKNLVNAYFEAIAASLGLGQKDLWDSERGRAFAGYAPVLAAVGSLLAKMENFIEVANRLRAAGAQEAWGVIETVLREILDREKGKLCDQVETQIGSPAPPEAYDREEQLTLLTQHVHGQPLNGSGRVQMSAPDQMKYTSMVERYVQEHPFVRDRELANVVLGSVVLAHAVGNDLLQDADLNRLIDSSRQPFLWRSLRPQLNEEALIDGLYVGCVLSSFWNDPITDKPRVVVRGAGDDDAARVFIADYCGGEVTWATTLPMVLNGQTRACEIDVPGAVELKGYGARGSEALFDIHGPTTIICESMKATADIITMDGDVWMEADDISAPPRLELRPKEGSNVGWGGKFASTYPWSRLPSTLKPPYAVQPANVLDALLEECWQRLPDGGVLTLNSDFTVPDDRRMRWAERSYGDAFPKLISLMVDHELATSGTMSASGTQKTRVHFEISWRELRNAAKTPSTASDSVRTFITAARTSIG